MNEPPGARARVGLSGLTVAEHFRDQGQDVLFFVDNIFRFTQAGSEVSALLGRIPSAVGYQPTLATDMGALQERITTTQKGSITSVQAIYVPADDLTDPAPATSFAHLDATTVLSRAIAEKGIYPAVDPLDSTSRMLDPRVIGEEHYRRSRAACSRSCSATRRCRTSSPFSAWTSLSEEDKLTVARARKIERFLSQPFDVAEVFTGSPGVQVKLEDTIKGFKGLCDGKYDHLPEPAFYMVGTIEEAVEKAQAPRGRGGLSGDGRWPLHFELVSPERLLLSGEVAEVDIAGHRGRVMVLARPCAGAVDVAARRGRRCRGPTGDSERIFVRGGFAEVNPQGLTVLAEMAMPFAELSPRGARAAGQGCRGRRGRRRGRRDPPARPGDSRSSEGAAGRAVDRQRGPSRTNEHMGRQGNGRS